VNRNSSVYPWHNAQSTRDTCSYHDISGPISPPSLRLESKTRHRERERERERERGGGEESETRKRHWKTNINVIRTPGSARHSRGNARLVKQFRFARRVYALYTCTAGIIDDQTRQDNLTDN